MIVFSMIMVPEELRRPLQRWLEEHMQHAALAEREACAAIAEAKRKDLAEWKDAEIAEDIRDAIRARPAP